MSTIKDKAVDYQTNYIFGFCELLTDSELTVKSFVNNLKSWDVYIKQSNKDRAFKIVTFPDIKKLQEKIKVSNIPVIKGNVSKLKFNVESQDLVECVVLEYSYVDGVICKFKTTFSSKQKEMKMTDKLDNHCYNCPQLTAEELRMVEMRQMTSPLLKKLMIISSILDETEKKMVDEAMSNKPAPESAEKVPFNLELESHKQAIRMDPSFIKYIESPSRQLCILAIERDYNALSFIKDQNQEYCLLAIGKHPDALFAIDKKNRTKEVYAEFLRLYPFLKDHLVNMG